MVKSGGSEGEATPLCDAQASDSVRLGWWILLGSWLLFGVSFLLVSYGSGGAGQMTISLRGWQCADACLHAYSLNFLSSLSPGMRAYVAGFTAVNALGLFSVPLAFIRSMRPRSPSFVLLPAVGYALSWFFYSALHHYVADLRVGYYAWTLSLLGIAYGLARVQRPQGQQQPIDQTDEL